MQADAGQPQAVVAPGATLSFVLPAFALIRKSGRIDSETDGFARLVDHESLEQKAIKLAIEQVAGGRNDRATAEITVGGKRREATIDAVILREETRRALLATAVDVLAPVSLGGAALFGPFVDDSPAVIWLKDLEGRYLHVNHQYTRLMRVTAADIRGRTDAELSPRESVEGVRRHGGDRPEPLQLEYTIASFESRPALAALRFPVRDSEGEPVAVCGVASPVGDARLGQLECVRLLQTERWTRLGPDAARADIESEWSIRPAAARAPATPAAPVAPAAPAAAAAPSPAADAELRRLQNALAGTQADLERAVAEMEAARRAHASSEQHLAEERERVAALHEASAASSRRAHETLAELERLRVRSAELEAQVAGLNARLATSARTGEEAQAALQSERDRTSLLEKDLATAHADRATLEAAVAAAHRRAAALEGEAEAAAAAAGRPAAELAVARARGKELEQTLAELEHALAGERGNRAQGEQALANEQAARIRTEHALAAADSARAQAEQALATGRATRAELEGALAGEQAARARAEATLAAAESAGGSAHAALAAERARTQELQATLAAAESAGGSADAALAAERARTQELQATLHAERVRARALDESLSAVRDAHAAAERAIEDERTQRAAAERTVDDESAQRAAVEQALDAERAARGQIELVAESERAARAAAERAAADDQAARAAAEQALDAERAAQADAARALGSDRDDGDDAARILDAERNARVRAEQMLSAERAARTERERELAAAQTAREAIDHALTVERAALAASEQALTVERAALAASEQELTVERAARADAERAASAARADAERAAAGLAAAPSAPAAATAPGAPAPGTEIGTAGRFGWTHGAQSELTRALATASSWRAALKETVKIVGSQGGWDVAIAWGVDERGRGYACVAMWMRNPDDMAAFETATWQRPQSAAGSEVGRAAAATGPIWLRDLSRTPDNHLGSAGKQGMGSALLLPLRHGKESAGVLELCTTQAGPEMPAIVVALESVATQLAHYEYLARLGESPRWRSGRM